MQSCATLCDGIENLLKSRELHVTRIIGALRALGVL